MNWECLSAGELADSVSETEGVCLIPLGCLEKHGQHLPLGTDIFIAREIVRRASLKERFMVFPFYPFGFVSEVRHKAGSIALSTKLQLDILREVCSEIARNGFRKILLANCHGGNSFAIRTFAQSQLDSIQDHLIYVADIWHLNRDQEDAIEKKHGTRPLNMHANVVETACIMAIDSKLVDMNRTRPGEGRSLSRLAQLEGDGIFTAVNWYANYPEQIAGDPAGATEAMGDDILDCNAANLAASVRIIKKNSSAAELLAEFYSKTGHPSA